MAPVCSPDRTSSCQEAEWLRLKGLQGSGTLPDVALNVSSAKQAGTFVGDSVRALSTLEGLLLRLILDEVSSLRLILPGICIRP